MEIVLSFFIIFIFFLITLFVMSGLYCPTEKFKNTENSYTPSKFYTYPPSKWEKINSLYSPIICRPPEHYSRTYSGQCRDILYPKSTTPFGKGEMAAPCKPEIEAKYYAMRPLLTPETYNTMLQEIFNKISQNISLEEKEWYPNEFCNKNCYSNVMKYIMAQINKASKNVFAQYSKNDTWGGEQFAFLNEQVFTFTTTKPPASEQEQAHQARYGLDKGPKKFIVAFTLHNTLRSTSTDCIATVYQIEGNNVLSNIEFSTKKASNWLATKMNLSFQEKPSWIYGNNIENETFNLKGFHDPDPSKNITIPGGVPQEFKEVLQKCDQAYLLDPSGNQGPRFKGAPFGTNNINKTAPIRTQNELWEVNV